jgi:hypothetical protein
MVSGAQHLVAREAAMDRRDFLLTSAPIVGRTKSRTLAACVALVAVMAASGCGGSPPPAAGETAAPAVQPPQASAPKKNACAFVDLPVLTALAGKPLTMLHEIEDTDLTNCEVSDPDNVVVVTVTVRWSGGKEQARANQAAMSMAKQVLNEDDVDILALTGSQQVRGLADKAFYSDIMPSWVLKGDVMVEVIAPLWNSEKTKKTFSSIARKALSQL